MSQLSLITLQIACGMIPIGPSGNAVVLYMLESAMLAALIPSVKLAFGPSGWTYCLPSLVLTFEAGQIGCGARGVITSVRA